ncbi:MAG TPA: hypothetical protein VN894_01585 [Polyangiaceae bacterium]|nr:hypothetical protein [Polyangiaceae bacterium]
MPHAPDVAGRLPAEGPALARGSVDAEPAAGLCVELRDKLLQIVSPDCADVLLADDGEQVAGERVAVAVDAPEPRGTSSRSPPPCVLFDRLGHGIGHHAAGPRLV